MKYDCFSSFDCVLSEKTNEFCDFFLTNIPISLSIRKKTKELHNLYVIQLMKSKSPQKVS